MRAPNRPNRPKHQKMRRIAIVNEEYYLGGKRYRSYNRHGYMRFEDIFFTAKRMSLVWKSGKLKNKEIVGTCGPADYCVFRNDLILRRIDLRFAENRRREQCKIKRDKQKGRYNYE